MLIKPTAADCNLRCEYCFYLGRRRLYPQTPTHRMSDNVLDRMIGSFMRTPQPRYSFGWQGGEPTLMGLDVFHMRDRTATETCISRSSCVNGKSKRVTDLKSGVA